MSESTKPWRPKLRNLILVEDAQAAKRLKEYADPENWNGDHPLKPLPRKFAHDLAHHHAYREMKEREILSRINRAEAAAHRCWEKGEVATAEAALLLSAMFTAIDDLTGIQVRHALRLILELVSLAHNRQLPEASFLPEPKRRGKPGRPLKSFPDSVKRQHSAAGVQILMDAGWSEHQSLTFVGKRLDEIDEPTPANTVRDWRQDVTSQPADSEERLAYEMLLGGWRSLKSMPDLEAMADPETFVGLLIHAVRDFR